MMAFFLFLDKLVFSTNDVNSLLCVINKED